MQQKIVIFDSGSQYTQLIARRLRELNIYCEIVPFNHILTLNRSIKGVIFSGSPASVRDTNAPALPAADLRGKVPILGVCYGAQYLVHHGGGQVEASNSREYGRARLQEIKEDALLEGIEPQSQVWMSHGDTILKLPEGFHSIASTKDVALAAFRVEGEPTYGLQFHPEVYHTTDGLRFLSNFAKEVCQCQADWTPASFIEHTVAELHQQIGSDKVVLGLSGGVDSTVAATLLSQAIGDRLHCIFVNNGLLRKNEFPEVLHQYKDMGLNVTGVDASDRFLSALHQQQDPEEKRKTIGRVFIEVFDQEAHRIDGVKWLGQGTIYPDIIESVSVNGPSATIKSHHNVGGLPETMKLQVVEPLKALFKDEVRRVGRALGISEDLLGRHPFPGPGLAIRVLGPITAERVSLLQEADYWYLKALRDSGWYDKVWQAGAILLPVQSVGVMGDERTYENAVALRAVESTDGMTADFVHLPHELLGEISNTIINKVKGINRVVYDISSKPPATIEWE